MNDGGPGPRTLTVVRQEKTLGAGRDLEFGLELLARAKSGDIGPTLRLYRPAPTVAFGQRAPDHVARLRHARRTGGHDQGERVP